MSQIITATFENGVLKPEGTLDLAPGTKVRLILEATKEATAGGGTFGPRPCNAEWPAGFFDQIHINDPAFVRPEQGQTPPAPSLP